MKGNYPAEGLKHEVLYTICPCCDSIVQPLQMGEQRETLPNLEFFGKQFMGYYMICECSKCLSTWAIFYRAGG